MAILKVGTRVVRGPDWTYKKQDSGEGFLGTIIYVPKQGSGNKKVTVAWDSGREMRYRAGHDGKYDLRVFDTAPTGIGHSDINCNECKERSIKGIRWECCTCKVSLCTPCYMNDKHDLQHRFNRIDTENSTPWAAKIRVNSKKIQSRGLFKDTEVSRGPHWKYKNDDGGEGQVGYIQRLIPWNKTCVRGGVEVIWKDDPSVVREYRVGGEGCVDVIYTRTKQTGSGGTYYPEHLPLVDVEHPGEVTLKLGDKVRVYLNLQSFRDIQEKFNYLDWKSSKMKQCLDELGTIVQILVKKPRNAYRVQYEDGNIWTISGEAIVRRHTFSKGAAVRILDDYGKVVRLQEGHGGFKEDMVQALGKLGRIISVGGDGDVNVQVEGKNWVFSPVCVRPAESEAEENQVPQITKGEDNSSTASDFFSSFVGKSSIICSSDMDEQIGKVVMGMLKAGPDSNIETVRAFVQAAQQGDLNKVKELIKASPRKIDSPVDGKTALHLACYEGHTAIVKLLLQNNANVNLTDQEGDSAIHFSAYGDEHDSIKELLKNSAIINCQNKKLQTPLHISVSRASPGCVRLLIENGADPKLKDEDGDTPMHDAVAQPSGQPQILKAIFGAQNTDFSILNKKGFNVLHWAALQNIGIAVELIVKENPKILDERTSEGFTALHIAAANGYGELANTLIKGKCNKDIEDHSKRTPMMICVLQGHKETLEVLLEEGCNVNAQDQHGNTALHLHVAKVHEMSTVQGIKMHKDSDDVGIQIICSLLEAKADVYIKNKDGETPLDVAEDSVRQFIEEKSKQLKDSHQGLPMPLNWDKMPPSAKFVKIPLNKGTAAKAKEFDMVAKSFTKTFPQATIVCIERVQNIFRWEFYCMKRKEFESKYGGRGCANELSLFHGTKADVVDIICKSNFDFRLAGDRVGTLFGKGTYFAADAKYSDLYASAGEDRCKKMFLAKVLAGRYTTGDPSFSRPPPIDPNDQYSDLYDCCVDDPHSPRVYCIFDNDQCYPQYIITYRSS